MRGRYRNTSIKVTNPVLPEIKRGHARCVDGNSQTTCTEHKKRGVLKKNRNLSILHKGKKEKGRRKTENGKKGKGGKRKRKKKVKKTHRQSTTH